VLSEEEDGEEDDLETFETTAPKNITIPAAD
jgi:hypothetical protein